MTSELTTSNAKDLRHQIAGDYFKQQVAVALPKHMTPDRFVRVALTALLKTPKLLDCTPESVIQCMLNCSALGLEPDGRRAHLIPYGTSCTLIVDYKGIVELAKRSGDVTGVFAQIVCQNDSFAWENGEVTHKIDWKNDRGAMYAAYATITFKDGTKQTDVMTRSEVDAIRKRSKSSGSGPWVTDYNEMAKKTVFRRASKWITLSPEVADVLEREDETDFSSTPIQDISTDDGDLAPAKPSFSKKAKSKETVVEAQVVPNTPPSPTQAPTPAEAPQKAHPAPHDTTKPPEPAQEAQKPTAADSGQPAEIVDLQAAMAECGVTDDQVLAFAKKKGALKPEADPDLPLLSDILASKVPILAKMIRQKGAAWKEMTA